MQVSLEITSGGLEGEKFALQRNRQVRIGRGANADIAITFDPLLSESHFAFWWDDKGCRIQDLESVRGTFLNGRRITEAAVRNGDKIVAGQTHFVVRVNRDSAVSAIASVVQPRGVVSEGRWKPATSESLRPPVQTTAYRDVLEILRSQADPLFAILDAARDPKVLKVLRNYDLAYQSLYEGVKGEVFAEFAPYLVELYPKSTLIETLVDEAWGNSWGVFLASTIGFKETRRHFRRFLLVQTEDRRELYFRFYDPRVLRVFLPSCTPQEVQEFFGKLSCFILETTDPKTLVKFTHTAGELSRENVPVKVLRLER